VVFLGVTMLTKSQASKLAQQRANAEEEAAAVKAEQQVEDEEADDMIGAGRLQVGHRASRCTTLHHKLCCSCRPRKP
jgi:hypothetical protein